MEFEASKESLGVLEMIHLVHVAQPSLEDIHRAHKHDSHLAQLHQGFSYFHGVVCPHWRIAMLLAILVARPCTWIRALIVLASWSRRLPNLPG